MSIWHFLVDHLRLICDALDPINNSIGRRITTAAISPSRYTVILDSK